MPEPKDFLSPSSYLTAEMKRVPSTKRRGKRATPQPKIKAQTTSTKKPAKKAEKKGGMSRERKIKLFKASVASPKTPEHLKIALKKKLKEMGA